MAIINGTSGNDNLQGTNGDDIINGLSRNDSIDAADGDDQLFGGAGDDTLIGGDGTDNFVIEQAGNSNNTITDFTQGEDKIDLRTLGISEFDTVSALLSNNAEGNVEITTTLGFGTSVTEILGISREQLSADDFIFDNSDDNDNISGGSGFDDLFGGDGNDTLNGGQRNDRLFGEDGNDRLLGGAGDDTLIGGDGADNFVIEQAGNSNNTITDFRQGEDKIDLRTLGISEFDTVSALLSNNAEGNVEITTTLGFGTSVTEILGISREQLSADDFIFDNSDDNDSISGGTGFDDLFGGDGNDTLDGGQRDDRLFGEDGDDRLLGGAGDDTLIGGSGTDTAVFSGALSDYEISTDNGTVTVENTSGNGDGTDVLIGVEKAQFSDQTVDLPSVATSPEAVNDSAITNENTAVSIDVLDNDSDADGDDLSIDSFTQPDNGTVTLNSDNTLTYTPNADFDGSDSFTYEVSDGELTDTGTVNVTVVDAGGNAPEATADSATTNEDTAVSIDVLDNDSDIDGDDLIVESVTQGSNGTVDINADGTVSYTPNANFNGSDNFTYEVSDGELTDTATVAITVEPVNDAPTATDDSATTNEDVAVSIDVLDNDSDLDGDDLSVESVTQGSNGTVNINADSTVSYTPNAGFDGSDTFECTVSDGELTDTATVEVTVIDDGISPPVATADSATTNEDTAVSIDVLDNDIDADGDNLNVESVTQGSNGTVDVNADGTVSYTPNADFNGSDSFTYEVSNGELSDTATVDITVEPINDAPTANADSATTDEDVAVSIDVLSNDSDVDGDSLDIDSFIQADNGTVTINADDILTYTPNAGFSGSDSFEYTVSDGELIDTATVQVTVDNVVVENPPTAVVDSATTNENVAVSIDVLDNDSDLDGDGLSVESVTQGSNGSVAINPDGTVTYTPDTDFSGSDSFEYTVSDGELTDTATVEVTVNDVVTTEPAIEVQQLVDADGDGVFASSEMGTAGGEALFQTEITNVGTVAVTIDEIADGSFSTTGSSLADVVGTTLAVGESVVGTYPVTLPDTVVTTVGTAGADTLDGQQTTEVGQITITASSGASEVIASDTASVEVELNDIIAGQLGDDTISGGGGDDVLRGDRNSRKSQAGKPGGDDVIFGGAGNDRIGGKSGNDSLFGDEGDDAIWGDDGDDFLRGGLGNDRLVGDDFSGGSGSDTFVLAAGEGTDTIVDFEIGIDLIGLADGLSLGALTFEGNSILFEDETLAILQGVDATSLDGSSFLSV
ncbi:S-layer family protein [cf. Phormidesmis sp. LEGE 11477]|uniref:beta strand repeat-containing protein n=1 Tax=cf. Phormidesmis sp. LEGE 11477 TaxID=1828680 RepID=UPI00187F86D6|nr:Ig-like domain-containing protein [cf. Phormidesmis sp. LEGE 11477]MBE9063540.1 tandem-95 repeat protein [cf. Phormidesmis sp. LEGE 11477]